MSKRLDVLRAVKALVQAALPGAAVLGVEDDGDVPEQIPANGRVVIRAGDPGQPEIDLSPRAYIYTHEIPLEIGAYASSTQTREQVIDTMLGHIGAAILANRTLGGLVTDLDAYAPETDDIFIAGATPAREALPKLVAEYSTNSPL